METRSLTQWLERLETLHPRAIDLGLERVASVAQALGLLPVGKPVVTVAGTNGKGSVVAVLDAVLRQGGLRTGAFTSPHLLRFNERIRVDGIEATDAEIVEALRAIDEIRGDTSLTYFEFSTLAALLVFRRAAVDVLVLEVGLGGRLDAVNIVEPTVAVITRIDLDHQNWLGSERGLIAREKAGILRRATPVVIGDADPPAELIACAATIGATPVLRLGVDFSVDTSAGYWRGRLRAGDGTSLTLPELPRGPLLPANIVTALQAALLLGCRVTAGQLAPALLAAAPRGRCEHLVVAGREYVLDVAHNPASVSNLVDHLNATPCNGRTFALFSAMEDKDIAAMIAGARRSFDGWFVAGQPANPRAAGAYAIADLLEAAGQSGVVRSADLAQALGRAQAVMAEGDRLVVFGSFFTVGGILSLLDQAAATMGHRA